MENGNWALVLPIVILFGPALVCLSLIAVGYLVYGLFRKGDEDER